MSKTHVKFLEFYFGRNYKNTHFIRYMLNWLVHIVQNVALVITTYRLNA